VPERRTSHFQPLKLFLTFSQIDWNKVAHDPILSQEITNGHAARMRYSRFKKQMDGTSAVRRPRTIPPPSPHKNRVEKSSKSPRKIKERHPSDAGDRVKPEAAESGYATPEGTPDVKREHASESPYAASTPVEPASPSPGFAGPDDMDDMNMMSSFEMPGADHMGHEHLGHEQLGHAHLFPGVLEDPSQAYGIGMHMPMGLVDPFENLWHQHPQPQPQGEGGVLVKTEQRWEETYRQG
jgi:hypothetical protein